MTRFDHHLIHFLVSARELATSRSPREIFVKAYRLWRREGISGLARFIAGLSCIPYRVWIKRHDTLTTDDRQRIVGHIEALAYRPIISVLMPVYNPPAGFLEKAIASVRAQLYPEWELCIVDDASTQANVRAILERVEKEDSRIRVVFCTANGHISAASNRALGMASGEFVALLDHDDELAEHALYHIAVALNRKRDMDILYSDEDKISAKGRRFGHYFKPDWNPDLFLSQNMINHLGVYRREIALAIGGFREGYEGSQDWDFALRFIERIPADHIVHIPRVLYHWRSSQGSTSIAVGVKNYAADAGRRSVLDYWQRQGIAATVSVDDCGHCTTHLPLPASPPLVSILICTRNRKDLLHQCVEGIENLTDYRNRELIIVDNGSDDAETLHYLDGLRESGVARVLRHSAPFNFSVLNNLAARHASGSLLCLMNNDVAPIQKNWLAEMVAHAMRPEIGVVGAKLYYPNGSIQHAGVILNGLAAEHIHLGYPENAGGYGYRARLAQNFSAVTAACCLVRKTVWDEVGGMDESLAVAFNDIDFCLRVRERGYRNLWLPQAKLYHYESASRGNEDTPEKQARFAKETQLLRHRWECLIADDPAWNPNLVTSRARICLASPPRINEPWHDVEG